MTSSGILVNQRDIILIPFPYTDLSQNKKRPVLVLSNSENNFNNEDVICCAITSNPRSYEKSVEFSSKDLEQGEIKFESRIKPNKVFTLNKELVVKKLAKLEIKKFKEVVNKVGEIFEIDF